MNNRNMALGDDLTHTRVTVTPGKPCGGRGCYTERTMRTDSAEVPRVRQRATFLI